MQNLAFIHAWDHSCQSKSSGAIMQADSPLASLEIELEFADGRISFHRKQSRLSVGQTAVPAPLAPEKAAQQEQSLTG